MRLFRKITVIGLCAAMLLTTAHAADIGTVNVDVLNVRNAASADAEVVGQLVLNTPVSISAYENGWNKIAYQGADAFVLGQYINVQFLEDGQTYLYGEPQYGMVNVDYLNVRAAASYEADIVRGLYKGRKLELIGQSGEFYAVQDGAAIQFVAKAYIDLITQEEFEQASAGDTVIATAMQFIGTPYVYGGRSPSGFDCSGFTSYVYSLLGISLNRTAGGQMSNGYRVELSDLQAGDLVFFGGGGGISHVGIYVGNGNMIHSPYSGRSVCLESIYSSYFGPRLVGARRIF